MSITFTVSIYFSIVSLKGIPAFRLLLPAIIFLAVAFRIFLIIFAIIIVIAIVVIFVVHIFKYSFIRVDLVAIDVPKVFDSLLHVFAFLRRVYLGTLSLCILLLLLFSKLTHLVPLPNFMELIINRVITEVVTDVFPVNLGAE